MILYIFKIISFFFLFLDITTSKMKDKSLPWLHIKLNYIFFILSYQTSFDNAANIIKQKARKPSILV